MLHKLCWRNGGLRRGEMDGTVRRMQEGARTWENQLQEGAMTLMAVTRMTMAGGMRARRQAGPHL